MGVFRLASAFLKRNASRLSQDEHRAFLVAALLHDIGTPAFGHLFEYQLAAIKGWHHEKIVSEVIRGTYRLEKRGHQIYAFKTIQLHSVLKELKVDTELVVSFINGDNPLGRVLAGSVDLDNIDSVHRMATLLGLATDLNAPLRLVNHLMLEDEGLVFEEDALPVVTAWQNLRRQAYEFLAFDEFCLSGQAMLTDSITIALKNDYLLEEHWFFTDEMLLQHLLHYEETKDIIRRFEVGDYYQQVFLGWYSSPKGKVDLRHHKRRAELAQALKEKTKIPCSPYVFYDMGTFSKRLRLMIRTTDFGTNAVDFGDKSESTIVGVFTPRRVSAAEQNRLFDSIMEVLEDYELYSSNMKYLPGKHSIYELPGQRTIPF
jgi:HD superfamily phosphohydrolase